MLIPDASIAIGAKSECRGHPRR